jgi:hypothetical protein
MQEQRRYQITLVIACIILGFFALAATILIVVVSKVCPVEQQRLSRYLFEL